MDNLKKNKKILYIIIPILGFCMLCSLCFLCSMISQSTSSKSKNNSNSITASITPINTSKPELTNTPAPTIAPTDTPIPTPTQITFPMLIDSNKYMNMKMGDLTKTFNSHISESRSIYQVSFKYNGIEGVFFARKADIFDETPENELIPHWLQLRYVNNTCESDLSKLRILLPEYMQKSGFNAPQNLNASNQGNVLIINNLESKKLELSCSGYPLVQIFKVY